MTCRLQGRILPEDMARLRRSKVDVTDTSAVSFFQLVRQGAAPRPPGRNHSVVPPYTFVVTSNTLRRDRLYQDIRQRADFDTMCGNNGTPRIHLRNYESGERFFRHACYLIVLLSLLRGHVCCLQLTFDLQTRMDI